MKQKLLMILSYVIIAILFLLVGILLGKSFNNRLEENKKETLITNKVAISTFLIVSQNQNDLIITEEDLTVINTYKDIINSRVVKQKVKEKYPNVNNIELEHVDGTGILKAIYTCDNYREDECIEITNKYVEEFAKNITEIYNINNISVIDSATISTRMSE